MELEFHLNFFKELEFCELEYFTCNSSSRNFFFDIFLNSFRYEIFCWILKKKKKKKKKKGKSPFSPDFYRLICLVWIDFVQLGLFLLWVGECLSEF